ncbi:MAG: TolC family protein [Muribaculaceae bacterium]|nr:TolC family protein [Muribaculaceae bacterium]
MMTVIGAEAMDTNAATTTWSFADCINHAHSHNVSLQKSRINERISDYELEAAEAQWLPSLDFATTHSYTNAPFSEGNKNAYSSNYGFNAGWTVWNGGIRQKNIKRNQIQSEIQKLITTDLFRSIETDILTIYMNILYAQESIRIYEETVALSKAQMERSEALMKSGRASKVDHAQLQSQYEQDYYTLVAAQGTYATRCMELKKILELGINDT